MPLFALTIMFSFTRRPKWVRRTRKAASRSESSWSSGALRIDRHSSRVGGSPPSVRSAIACQSDTRFLPERDEPGIDLAGKRPPPLAEGRDAPELLDQLAVRLDERVVAVQDDAGDVEAGTAEDFDREQRVVHRAEAGAGDDEDGHRKRGRQVEDRPPLAHRDEHAPGTLDERQLVTRRELLHARVNQIERELTPFRPRGDERGDRPREPERRDLVERLAELGQVLQRLRVAAAGLERLHHADVETPPLQRERERGRDDGLADARVGSGDEDASQVDSSIACRRIAVIAARSSSSVASGG